MVERGAIHVTLSILLLLTVRAAGGATAAELDLQVSNADIRPVESLGPEEAATLARQTARQESAEVWLAYRVESIQRTDSICCFRGPCCSMDDEEGLFHGGPLEISSEPILVLLRFDEQAVRRLRVVSDDCPIGFAGRTVLWAGDVDPADSLAFLRRWTDKPVGHLADDALVAVAYHRGAAAGDLLAEVASSSQSRKLAKEATFWLGTARGLEGYEHLEDLLSTRPDREMMKALVFALSESPVEAASQRLVALAQTDPEPEVRSEALFWLGQSGTSHADLILEAALTDREQDVAEHAVFVLSQLPEPDNVELLARVLAQQERPELRKEALFWIGQSNSPEALDIVSRILNQ